MRRQQLNARARQAAAAAAAHDTVEAAAGADLVDPGTAAHQVPADDHAAAPADGAPAGANIDFGIL